MPRSSRHPAAFTLIELLVVIAIITTLIAILLPSMGQAMGAAQIAACAAHSRQVGAAGLTYRADHVMREMFWRWEDWTGDYPYESAHTRQPGNPARALHRADGRYRGYLPTGELFFCPTYEISHANNYHPEPSTGSQFWGTYTWHYRPLTAANDPHPGLTASNYVQFDNPSQAAGVVMADTPSTAYGRVPSFLYGPTYEHYNALFEDGRVELISRDVKTMGRFLWGPNGTPRY